MDVFTQGMEKESFDYSNWIQITSQYDNYRFWKLGVKLFK